MSAATGAAIHSLLEDLTGALPPQGVAAPAQAASPAPSAL
jgi:hypothetical protein